MENLASIPERFEMIRPLGEGGMGVVYQAFDRERGFTVALKTLKQLSPYGLYLFKNEFRALADLHHPNLIQLHELIHHQDSWFLSMELLHGRELLSFICDSADALPDTGKTESQPPPEEQTAIGFPQQRPDGASPPPNERRTEAERRREGKIPTQETAFKAHTFNEDRLRESLRQLAEGIATLHELGMVHRDIKPSNVFVTDDNRVVLMDFGLVIDASGEGDGKNQVMGTPAYMAPEQAAAGIVGLAADWYAVGVILYQALTGVLPFSGGSMQVMIEKQHQQPKPPSELSQNIPPDLESLCMSLLSIDPTARPKGSAILSALGSSTMLERSPRLPINEEPSTPVFVGREIELSELKKTFKESRRQAIALLLEGESGVGKSALLKEFLAPLPALKKAVVFRGRCYEREQVPYKAFDGMMDSLCRFLLRLEGPEVTPLLPSGIVLLAKLFPVLRRVSAIRRLPEPTEASSPGDLRAEAFNALRELLGAIAAKHPVVMAIDDLQWADKDSAALLADILRPPAPPVLLIATCRDLSQELSLVLAGLGGALRRQKIGRLSSAEASELLRGLGEVSSGSIDSIVREAGGHPLFLKELHQHSLGRPEGERIAQLDDALVSRVSLLEGHAQRLLELIVVAGAPTEQGVIFEASALPTIECNRLISGLRAGQLVRTTGARRVSTVEPYHDRIREAISASLSTEGRRQCHLRLAKAMESSQQEPQTSMRHWLAGGEYQKAAQQAEQAAQQAAAALAFEQAAEMYGVALRFGRYNASQTRELHLATAEALANAGRSKESAEAFLLAAKGATPTEQLQRQAKAAKQFLGSGHLEQGLSVLREVLALVGERWPSSPQEALATILWNLGRLKLRGLRWRERRAQEIPPDELLLIDVHMVISTCMGPIDPIRATAFQSKGIRLVLDSGEWSRVIPVLSGHAAFMCMEGPGALPQATKIIHELSSMVEARGDQKMRVSVAFNEGLMRFFSGHFRAAEEKLQFAEEGFRREFQGHFTENGIARVMWSMAAYFVGHFGEVQRRVPEYLREAARRGDRYTEASLTYGPTTTALWLSQDEPGLVRQVLQRTLWSPPPGNYHAQDWYKLVSRVDLALYDGEPPADRWIGDFEVVRGSMLLRLELIRVYTFWMEGRLALSLADVRIGVPPAKPANAHVLASEIERAIKQLQKEHLSCAKLWSLFLQAGLSAQRNSSPVSLLREALQLAESEGLKLYAAAARYRLGQCVGGDAGSKLVETAAHEMHSEGVKRPEKIVRLFTPGFSNEMKTRD